jgi:hypothetical protein
LTLKNAQNNYKWIQHVHLWCVHLIIFQKKYYCVENIKPNNCQQHMDEVGGSLLGSDL